VKRGLNAKEKANKGLQRHNPSLGYEQQMPPHQSKKYQVVARRKKRRLAKKQMPLLPIARRIL